MALWGEEECQDSLLDDADTGRQVTVRNQVQVKSEGPIIDLHSSDTRELFYALTVPD